MTSELKITNWDILDGDGNPISRGLEDPRVSDQAAMFAVREAEDRGEAVWIAAAWDAEFEEDEPIRVEIEVEPGDAPRSVSNALIAELGGSVAKSRGFA